MFLGWTPVSVAPLMFDSRVQPQGPGRSLGVGHLTENRLPRSGFAVAARGNAPNEELRRSSSRCLGGFTLQGTQQKICWVFFNWEVFKVKTSMVFKKLSPTCIETSFNWLQKMMSFLLHLADSKMSLRGSWLLLATIESGWMGYSTWMVVPWGSAVVKSCLNSWQRSE